MSSSATTSNIEQAATTSTLFDDRANDHESESVDSFGFGEGPDAEETKAAFDEDEDAGGVLPSDASSAGASDDFVPESISSMLENAESVLSEVMADMRTSSTTPKNDRGATEDDLFSPRDAETRAAATRTNAAERYGTVSAAKTKALSPRCGTEETTTTTTKSTKTKTQTTTKMTTVVEKVEVFLSSRHEETKQEERLVAAAGGTSTSTGTFLAEDFAAERSPDKQDIELKKEASKRNVPTEIAKGENALSREGASFGNEPVTPSDIVTEATTINDDGTAAKKTPIVSLSPPDAVHDEPQETLVVEPSSSSPSALNDYLVHNTSPPPADHNHKRSAPSRDTTLSEENFLPIANTDADTTTATELMIPSVDEIKRDMMAAAAAPEESFAEPSAFVDLDSTIGSTDNDEQFFPNRLTMAGNRRESTAATTGATEKGLESVGARPRRPSVGAAKTTSTSARSRPSSAAGRRPAPRPSRFGRSAREESLDDDDDVGPSGECDSVPTVPGAGDGGGSIAAANRDKRSSSSLCSRRRSAFNGYDDADDPKKTKATTRGRSSARSRPRGSSDVRSNVPEVVVPAVDGGATTATRTKTGVPSNKPTSSFNTPRATVTSAKSKLSVLTGTPKGTVATPKATPKSTTSAASSSSKKASKSLRDLERSTELRRRRVKAAVKDSRQPESSPTVERATARSTSARSARARARTVSPAPTRVGARPTLTVPAGPRLSTARRFGERSYSASRRADGAHDDASTLDTRSSAGSSTPRALTKPEPFNLSRSRSATPSSKAYHTFAETVSRYERGGIRDDHDAASSKWDSSRKPTVPAPFAITPSKPRDPNIKSTEERDQEMMDHVNAHPFKARPLPRTNDALHNKGETGLPKPHRRDLTTFDPFDLRTDLRGAEHAAAHEPPPTTEEMRAVECARQFHARPLPDLNYRPPPPTVRREVTTPEPFALRTDARGDDPEEEQHRPPTTEDVEAAECAHQFHARPMPDLTYRPPRVHVDLVRSTTPQPFRLATEERRGGPLALPDTDDDFELRRQFKALPLPDLTYRPPGQPIVPRHLTAPVPFRLETEARREADDAAPDRATTEEMRAVECLRQFRARPMPDLTYQPTTTQATRRPAVTEPEPFRLETEKRADLSTDDLDPSHVRARRNVLARMREKKKRAAERKNEKNAPQARALHTPSLTVPEPFDLRCEARRELYESRLKIAREEEDRLARRAREYKARPAPKVHQRPFTPRRSDKTLTEVEPFRLGGADRREKHRRELEKRVEEEKREAERLATSFRSTPAPNFDRPFTPARASTSRPRVHGTGPRLRTRSRSEHRHEFDEKARRKREQEHAKEEERERSRKEKEEEELSRLRRLSVDEGGLCFEAKPVNHALDGVVTGSVAGS